MRPIILTQPVIFLFLLASIASPRLASAQACDPKSFSFQETERIDASDSVKYSNLSIMEKSSDQKEDTELAGSAVIYGVPVNLSYRDSKALAEHILTHNDVRLSRDQKFNYSRTVLSAIGADMYKACLAAQPIRVSLPSSAYTQDAFDLILNWNPDGRAPDHGDFEVRVIGGTVENAARLQGDIVRGNDTPLQIERSPAKHLQITILAFGKAYPTIEIPAVKPILKPQYVLRYGEPVVRDLARERGGNRCGRDPQNPNGIDEAYLVSEVGSSAGSESKTCTLCIRASSNGLLLRDTTKVVTGTVLSPVKDVSATWTIDKSSPHEVCATFKTIGHGKTPGPDPRSEINDGLVYAYEAVYP